MVMKCNLKKNSKPCVSLKLEKHLLKTGEANSDQKDQGKVTRALPCASRSPPFRGCLWNQHSRRYPIPALGRDTEPRVLWGRPPVGCDLSEGEVDRGRF